MNKSFQAILLILSLLSFCALNCVSGQETFCETFVETFRKQRPVFSTFPNIVVVVWLQKPQLKLTLIWILFN